jgi:hypothetical protein
MIDACGSWYNPSLAYEGGALLAGVFMGVLMTFALKDLLRWSRRRKAENAAALEKLIEERAQERAQGMLQALRSPARAANILTHRRFERGGA